MKKSIISIAITGVIYSSCSFSAGLGLSQIGTAESVATAGAAGATNNRDASATITNAAGLSGIIDNSTVIGIQYLNVGNEFERDLGDATSKGESDLFMPHLSYAQRLNEEWVIGLSAHSAGGLGMDYSNGLTGGVGDNSLVDSNMIAIMNLTTSAAYQVSDQLSLGGSLIAQYATVKSEFSGVNNHEIKDESWAPSFALSAMYQLDDTTHFGMTYNYGGKHELEMNNFGNVDLNWPQMVEIGVQHQLTDDLAIMANANWQQWSRFGDDYKDTYGIGMALSYQLQDWTLQTGASIDSSPLDSNHRGHALPLDQQWRVGFGGHKTLSNGMVLGLAYQYQSLGDADIINGGITEGYYETNRVHFITGSLSF